MRMSRMRMAVRMRVSMCVWDGHATSIRSGKGGRCMVAGGGGRSSLSTACAGVHDGSTLVAVGS